MLLTGEKVDVVCLSEHWLGEGAALGLCVEGYTVAAMYCRHKTSRGGVCILVKNHFSKEFVTMNSITHLCLDTHFEATAVYFPKFRTTIMAVYRSPSGTLEVFFERFEEALRLLIRDSIKIVICGDFNIHFWSSSGSDLYMLDVLNSFGLRATIKGITRPTASGGSCIDNIITNLMPGECSAEVLPSAISDHEAQVFVCSTLKHRDLQDPGVSHVRVFNKNNINKFMIGLSGVDWASVLSDYSVEAQFHNFHRVFMGCFYSAFPKVTSKKRSKKQPVWLSDSILKAKEDLLDWYILQRDFPLQYKEIFKRKKREYRNMISKAKSTAAEAHISSSTNTAKAVWQVVKGASNFKKGNSDSIINDIEFNGQHISSPYQIASIFNDYFIKQSFGASGNNIPSSFSAIAVLSQSFFCTPTTEYEVNSVISSMKNSRSCDVYDISPFLIKTVADCVVTPLTVLFNNSITEGVFPSILKISKVVPVFKKADKKCISNYRPISLLPIFGKIFERLVYSRLVDFFVSHGVISDNQFGFTKGKSTSDAINLFFTTILSSIDNNKYPFGIFCDLTQAFDTVNHSLLLDKLEACGVRGMSAEWVKSYLSGRSQCVEISHSHGKSSSEYKYVTAGVPQGSILGPLLFLVYVNDLGTNIDGQVIKYADDTSVIVQKLSACDSVNHVERVIDQLGTWFDDNHLSLNLNKTSIMSFKQHSYNPDISFVLNKLPVELSDSVLFLGLRIDSDLKWTSQVNHISSKLNRAIFCLRCLSGFVSKHTLLMVYFGYVQSTLSYGLMFWGTASVASLKRIFVLQKRALRIVCGLKPTESCRGHFRREGILTLASLFIFGTSVFVYKNSSMFGLQNHSYNTRHKTDFLIPSHKLSIFQKSVLYLGPKIFNCLPSEIKMIKSLNSFKSRLRALLVERELYSINEFYNNDC